MGVKLDEHHGSYVLRINHEKYRKTIALGRIGELDAKAARGIQAKAALELASGKSVLELTVLSGKREAGALDPGYTVARAWSEFLAQARTFKTLAESSAYEYQCVAGKWILPALGGRHISKVQREDVARLVTAVVEAGNRKTYARQVLRITARLFSWLIEEKKLSGQNPATNFGRLFQKERALDAAGKDEQSHVKPFDTDEREKLVRYFKAHSEHRHLVAVLVGLRAGLRIGEVFGLRIGDIDCDSTPEETARGIIGHIRVRRQADKHGVVSIVKTKAGRRTVDIRSAELASALKLQIADRIKNVRGDTDDLPLIAGGSDGRSVTRWGFYERFRLALQECGLAGHVFHDTRHTFATELYARTRDLSYVSAQLGHASTMVTSQVYVHFLPSHSPAASMDDEAPVQRGRKLAVAK
jgi:integrase